MTPVHVKLVMVGGTLLAYLLWPKKPAVAAPAVDEVLDMPPDIITVNRAHPHLELSNGNDARVLVSDDSNANGGNVTNGTYFDCVDKNGNPLADSECSLVRTEWPDVTVPIEKLVAMTGGRVL